MKLNELFQVFPNIPENIYSDKEITGIFSDARQVIKDSIFICIRGGQKDGHDFIPQAIENGAVALVVEQVEKVPEGFNGFVLQVENSRNVVDILASRFYNYPSKDMFCIGVTGTNGKTSITYMLECILNGAGFSTGVIGTINHHLGNQIWPTGMTTPDPIFLQKRILEFKEQGANALAIEVSSHALDQKRVDSVLFNSVVFTNLTRDHLDYHGTMESYFLSKQRLFNDLLWKSEKFPVFAIVNSDDEWGRKLKIPDPVVLWTYGEKNADFTYKIVEMDFTSTKFILETPFQISSGKLTVELPMTGKHNVANAVAAIAVAFSMKIPVDVSINMLKNFLGVPGRLQVVPKSKKDLSVLVDYAHSPDALENVLQALQKIRKDLKSDSKIWTIFGCGGDRDKGKRPLMAEMACKYSDQVMVTSDNPRTEDPLQIIDDIKKGIPVSKLKDVQIEPDRKLAIEQVIRMASAKDVILIAGKGHEDYQIIGTEKIHFSDYEIAQELL